ncbi:metal ABC transporter ATP-binding protein [Symbiobacterium thermophilum]|uniref:ABC transporter ATP-binding protein n=1 Tax=Symbiobacterium thermophilum (strain DSM 24528 / JCM 14929 / IAM 14863 / T) TaxID=292459 RepID=Q67PA1_SYMTH|nr:metal ABC transporter ATP-binding protein [Symbiobacterium thermophilum]BAD40492.1 ABC transporter ATP-binding protein [Symbiobacterium thermophilum IAM 14863]
MWEQCTAQGELPVVVRGLTVAYQRRPVLEDVNLSLPPGLLIGVIGPNGAGKSTLLKAILGLVPRVAGEVWIYGRPVAEARRAVGYVPQRAAVDWDFPTDVLDVVTMGRYGHLGLFRRPGARERAVAMEALEKVGMADLAHRQIGQLSGGQQQRVFLARALAQDARIYFMDEPFAGVDAATERAIIGVLHEMKARGRTVVVVHHDLQTVREYFDWLVFLNGHVLAAGPVERVFTPENLARTYGGRLGGLAQLPAAPQAAGRGWGGD